MTAETIATFTRKIVASNRSELICVLYEIYFSYEQEAIEALTGEGKEAGDTYTKALRQCGQDALDFSYKISYSLYALYDFVERQLAKAMYEQKVEMIQSAGKIMRDLEESFVRVAKQDASGPMMGNAQQVTAGLTYGKGQLNESMGAMESNRGFFA